MLQDLLSGVSLEHEDSWEVPTVAPPQLSLAAAQVPRSSRTTSSSTAPASARGPAASSARPASTFFPPLSVGAAAAAGPTLRFDEALQEGDLPPAAAARLYAARLKAAQADLEGLQAALKARDIKLGAAEKEVLQLR